jgi:CRISPR/Cas system-associated protein Cas10 (large subunit of type III CRISPR-Cas system)
MSTITALDTATDRQANMRTCAHCGNLYDWRHSASRSMKMTYCGSLCEVAELGFTIDGLIHDLSWAKSAA